MMKRFLLILLILFSFFPLKTYPAIPEKPLYIVVTSFNNALWFKKNLDSILTQEYSNYRIIYVDDGSTDGTAELVEKYIQEFDLEHKIILIKNETRQWKMKNLYLVYHLAKDWEIICQIDGDDFLPHSKVFQEINEAYTKNDIWITYGKFRRVRDEKSKFQIHHQRWWL